MTVKNNEKLSTIINNCKSYLDTIQDFCNNDEYGLADISRCKLQDELDELECILETVQCS